ncbi:MAG: YlxR family protein [Bacilli bacterium]
MQKVKKIPIRRCLATNTPHPKAEMFRIVRTPEGEVKIDPIGKMNGRGAYLSKTKEAIMLAIKKKMLDKQLEITIPDAIYDELLAKIDQ